MIYIIYKNNSNKLMSEDHYNSETEEDGSNDKMQNNVGEPEEDYADVHI